MPDLDGGEEEIITEFSFFSKLVLILWEPIMSYLTFIQVALGDFWFLIFFPVTVRIKRHF